jgi:hypothetical protein
MHAHVYECTYMCECTHVCVCMCTVSEAAPDLMYSAMYLYNLFNDALFLPETAAHRRKALSKALTLSALPSDPSRFGRCFSALSDDRASSPPYHAKCADSRSPETASWWSTYTQHGDDVTPAGTTTQAHVCDPFLDDPATVQLATGVSFLRAAQLAVEAVAVVASKKR